MEYKVCGNYSFKEAMFIVIGFVHGGMSGVWISYGVSCGKDFIQPNPHDGIVTDIFVGEI